MNNFSGFRLVSKAGMELGLQPLALYAHYQLGLRSGYLQWKTPVGKADPSPLPILKPFLMLPPPGEIAERLGTRIGQLLTEAEEIAGGKVRLFGGEPQPLQLIPDGPLVHWTDYEKGRRSWGAEDVKFIWEPGRFGWAYTLVRAHHLSGDGRYAESFWEFTEQFLDANPPNLGPHWASAQEVALRLIALVFAYNAFADDPATSSSRRERLSAAIAHHAARIPPTLTYARAQNNNHLLSEAAGLYTAGLALPDHRASRFWRYLGWHWFNQGLKAQIASDGTYTQHSTNYHRVMLQLVLWFRLLAESEARTLSAASIEKAAAATRWALALVDPESGWTPNLGPSDGAYIMPLSVCHHRDFRPVLDAAARVFLKETPFAPGPWEEQGLWLGCGQETISPQTASAPPSKTLGKAPSCILRQPANRSWAYLRVAHFSGRPGHADQLHLDLWWRGVNLALDPGTYHYNAPPPWENALARTAVHNTVTIEGVDQMTRAGRFLWLDWAQALLLPWHGGDITGPQATAEHDGYEFLGVQHRRSVTAADEGSWVIQDDLQPLASAVIRQARLHWLLPDWPWEMTHQDRQTHLRVQSPHGWVTLTVQTGPGSNCTAVLIRGGAYLFGDGPPEPTWGWRAPVYGKKEPALSFSVTSAGPLPLSFVSEWKFP